jgi:four helix bundle protein
MVKMEAGDYGYKKLRAWEVADEIAREVYRVASKFPKEELYGVTSQLRRAALSVPTNIVEGYARASKNEFRRFVAIALGSLAEVDYLLGFSHELGYLEEEEFEEIKQAREECGRLLWKLLESQK